MSTERKLEITVPAGKTRTLNNAKAFDEIRADIGEGGTLKLQSMVGRFLAVTAGPSAVLDLTTCCFEIIRLSGGSLQGGHVATRYLEISGATDCKLDTFTVESMQAENASIRMRHSQIGSLVTVESEIVSETCSQILGVLDKGRKSKISGALAGAPPATGEFVMWTTGVCPDLATPAIIKLLVPENATRQGTARVRANKALVLEIRDAKGELGIRAFDRNNENLVYSLGEYVELGPRALTDYVHGYMTRELAVGSMTL